MDKGLSQTMKAIANRDAKEELKRRLAPRLLWDSRTQGTYIRKQHGPLPGHK
jgi:hypothetical protein